MLLQQNQEIVVDITTTVVEEIALTEEVSFIHKQDRRYSDPKARNG